MPAPPEIIEWAVAGRPLPGETESGDLHVVEPFPEGVCLAAIDGLGHGREAAAAARLAGATLRAHAPGSVVTLVQLCHERLRSTRGVVMSVASLSARDATITWLGIGNVDGYLIRTGTGGEIDQRGSPLPSKPMRETIVQRGGVVGHQLPTLRPTTIGVRPGDTLVLATDGIASAFIERPCLGRPQEIADDILSRYGKATDDALVLVARYGGAAG